MFSEICVLRLVIANYGQLKAEWIYNKRVNWWIKINKDLLWETNISVMPLQRFCNLVLMLIPGVLSDLAFKFLNIRMYMMNSLKMGKRTIL